MGEDETKQDIIDNDLYEEIDEEEMDRLVEEGKRDILDREREERLDPKPKRPFPKWPFWLISIAMVLNLVALLPQTFSIPAIDFLMTSAKLSTQDDIKSYKEAVVVIETGDSKGTGFSISSEGQIITNHHVVEGEETVTVAFPKDGLFKAEVVEIYPEIDLAILEVHSNDLPYLELASKAEFEEGEPINFIGNPLRFQGIANEGKVIDYIRLGGWEEDVIMLDAPVYRGNSGSPVINKEGKVIGVIFATLEDEEHGKIGLFFPIDYYYKYHK